MKSTKQNVSVPPSSAKSKNERNADLMKDIGNEFSKQQTKYPLQKKKTLHMYDFKKFKYMKTEDVHKRYIFSDKQLGRGAFGQVLRCTHEATGLEFAVKVMTKR